MTTGLAGGYDYLLINLAGYPIASNQNISETNIGFNDAFTDSVAPEEKSVTGIIFIASRTLQPSASIQ